jgi:hypothetical protein
MLSSDLYAHHDAHTCAAMTAITITAAINRNRSMCTGAALRAKALL